MIRDMAGLASFIKTTMIDPRRRNPELPGQIRADLGIINGIRMVTVLINGQVRPCIYTLPYPPEVSGGVFVARMTNSLTASWYVVASNYQVPSTPIFDDGSGGADDGYTAYGVGPYGTGPYGR